jgi:hypothetical protein
VEKILAGERVAILGWMAALSSRKIGALAGVSHQAVEKAVRRGHLVRLAGSTRLDPEASPNREWIARRARHTATNFPVPEGSEPAPAAPTEPPWNERGVVLGLGRVADRCGARRSTLAVIAGRYQDRAGLSLRHARRPARRSCPGDRGKSRARIAAATVEAFEAQKRAAA